MNKNATDTRGLLPISWRRFCLWVAVLVTVAFFESILPAQAQIPPAPYNSGGGQKYVINGVTITRDTVFRFLPVTLPLGNIRVTSLYGFRKDPINGLPKFHAGVDFGNPLGTPIYSTAAGIVTMVEFRGLYGKMVEIRHGLGFATRYSHLDSYSVSIGDIVDRNTILGSVGTTGWSTGPHLYYEIWANGNRVDPINFILNAYNVYHHLK